MQLGLGADFRRLFSASLFWLFGDGLCLLVSIVLVNNISSSATAIGMMFVATIIPSAVLAPFVGAFIDRVDSRFLAGSCQLARAAVLLIVGILTFIGKPPIELVYGVILLNEALFFFLNPTTDTLSQRVLAPADYVRGESLLYGAWQVGLMISSIIAGALTRWIGIGPSFVLTAAAYSASAILFFGLPEHRTAAASGYLPRNSYVQDVREGWVHVLNHRPLLMAALVGAMPFPLFQALNVLIAPYNYRLLLGNELTLGLIDSAMGFGGIISAVMGAWMAKRVRANRLLVAAVVTLQVSLALFVQINNIAGSFALYALVGASAGTFKVLAKSIIYRHADSVFAGRIMTAVSTLALTLGIAAAMGFSAIADISIGRAYLILAVLLIVPATLAALSSRASGHHDTLEVAS